MPCGNDPMGQIQRAVATRLRHSKTDLTLLMRDWCFDRDLCGRDDVGANRGGCMSDRTDVLAFERHMNAGDAPRTSEPRSGHRPATLQMMPFSRQRAGVGEPVPVTASMPDQASSRKSYFARIVD